MMMYVNPLIRIYRTAREHLQAQDSNFRMISSPQMTLVIQTGAERRRENLPLTTDVAAVILDEYDKASCRDVTFAVREPGRDDRQMH